MEMDFLGPRSAPRHAMPLVARRDAEDDGEPWLLASPARVVAYPDVRAAAAAAHRHHPTAPSYQVRAPPPHPQAFPFAIPASSLQGPQVVHSAAYAPDQRCSAAQLTIFYAGSVHVFDNVTREKADQITFMAAKAAQAGGSPPVVRRALRQSESAPVPDERKQMPLARACSDPVHPSPHALFVLPPRDVPLARSASLARFLERRKRKQRTANAATPYSRREISPASVDTFHMVSPGNTTLSGNTELSWFFGDEKAGSRDEEALDTELKM